jgi:hypothetical protein
MHSKRESNRERATQFALQVKTFSGLSWAKLEAALGMSAVQYRTTRPGKTLERWSKGRSELVKMRNVQQRAKVAMDKGLLPPLRDGLLHRPDTFGVLHMKRDADEAWDKEEMRLQAIESLHERTIEQIKELARNLAGDSTIVAMDSHGNEVHARDLLKLADKLRSISLHKIGH